MKKKLMIICSFLAVVVIGLVAEFWLRPEIREVQLEGEPIQGEVLELVGLANTREEAEEIAGDYGITLLSYSENVAVFQTDKTYEEILETGKNKGLVELSINHENTVY